MSKRLETSFRAKAQDDMEKNFEPLFHTGAKFSDDTRAYTAMHSGLTVVIPARVNKFGGRFSKLSLRNGCNRRLGTQWKLLLEN
jgi:hypothetical protein